jgi:hypothetical protein
MDSVENEEIYNPYKRNIIQEGKITLDPKYINKNIDYNILMKAREELEKKCNTMGFVNKITAISKKSDGYLIPENLNASPRFIIEYVCNIFIIKKDVTIISQIVKIVPDYIVCKHGYIGTLIRYSNEENFVLKNSSLFFKNNNKVINVGDFVKVNIFNEIVVLNNTYIQTLGNITSIPSDKEVKTYFDFEN